MRALSDAEVRVLRSVTRSGPPKISTYTPQAWRRCQASAWRRMVHRQMITGAGAITDLGRQYIVEHGLGYGGTPDGGHPDEQASLATSG